MGKRGRPPKGKQRGKKDTPVTGTPKLGSSSARSESGRFISKAEAGSKVGRPRKRAYDVAGVVLFDIPKLNITSVQSATRPLRSAAPVQLEEWTDTQLSGLRSELDSLLAAVRNLSKKLGGETDYMGVTMKNCSDPHIKALLERDLVVEDASTAATAAFVATPSNKRARNAAKFNSKRSRRDSTTAEDEEMTDINVVDVDDTAHSVPVPDDISEPDLNSSYESVGTNRNRNKKKSGRASSARDRKKKKKADENYSSEDDYSRQPTTSANFWQSISPFYKTLTVADLLPLTPQSLADSDPDFVIPPLGKHYSESGRSDASWGDSTTGKPTIRGKLGLDGDVRCGDVTQRILAALIEEKLIVQPNPVENNFHTPMALALDSPPTADYSRAAMLSLDDRIRLELRSIGLIDDDDDDASGNREDDEICAEIRHLQGQLREQIRVNNERRRIFLCRAEVKMAEQLNSNAKRAENKAIEQLFQRRMKLKAKIKKKKGRPPRAKPTRSSTAAAAATAASVAATPPATAGKGNSTDKSQANGVPPPVGGEAMDTVPPPPPYAV